MSYITSANKFALCRFGVPTLAKRSRTLNQTITENMRYKLSVLCWTHYGMLHLHYLMVILDQQTNTFRNEKVLKSNQNSCLWNILTNYSLYYIQSVKCIKANDELNKNCTRIKYVDIVE